jgi:hypothetical protein
MPLKINAWAQDYGPAPSELWDYAQRKGTVSI